jgi:sialic acid synthase SpsE
VRDIRPGEPLTRDNIAVLRCGKLGFGLPPEALERVIGRTAARAIGAESLIRLEDLK